MKIIKCQNTSNITKKEKRKVEYIVIHYSSGVSSAPGSAAKTALNWFAKPAAKASADYIVDEEAAVLYNPDIANYYCWSVGGSKYNTKGGSYYKKCWNSNSISIEMCSKNSKGKITVPNDPAYSISTKVIENTIELTKQLMKKYNIDAAHVIRHYDVTGKLCPGVIGWNAESGDESAWLKFKERLNDKKKTSPIKVIKVRVLTDDLPILRKANKMGKTVGYTGKGVFTVVEKAGNFGLLKSHAEKRDGWIPLNSAKTEIL